MQYVCLVRYLGTDFCGFQVQPERRTVQGTVQAAAQMVLGCPCRVTGCSRTDSGVHANGFCLTVAPEGPCTVPAERFGQAMAACLPPDVSVMQAGLMPDTFHPRYAALGKEYLYLIWNGRVRDPFLFGRAMHFPKPLTGEALCAMQRAAEALCGTHDFASFMAEGSSVQSTVRTVTAFTIEKEGDLVRILVSADGFLYNMVRILVGTLLDVAVGRKMPEQMTGILAGCSRTLAGQTAPAEGLYLNRVFYPSELQLFQ